MSDSIQIILTAVDFAARKHKSQRRKGSLAEPYINHPIEVARLLSTVGGIHDTDILVAAILHDTIEDTETTSVELTELFGARAASIVVEVSDDKKLPKLERKKMQIKHAPHLSAEAKLVKLADKISNIEDIAANPPEGWSIERKLEYIEWGINVIGGLRGINAGLEELFEKVTTEALKEIGDQG
ncbi:MAG: HD domain-containing protein [Acidobacteriota bacterium]|nr:HD domain-containing protein [Acidobacteriota bacterium]